MALRLALPTLLASCALFVSALGPACGTEPVGVDSCRKIERARCENAPGCGIDLTRPVHRGDTSERDVAACVRFYEDACLHGFAAPSDPGSVAVQACVDAIHAGSCEVVKMPEVHPSCAFLVPPPPPAPPPPVDAGADG